MTEQGRDLGRHGVAATEQLRTATRPVGRTRERGELLLGSGQAGAGAVEHGAVGRTDPSTRRAHHVVGVGGEAEPLEDPPLLVARLLELLARAIAAEARLGPVLRLQHRRVGGLDLGDLLGRQDRLVVLDLGLDDRLARLGDAPLRGDLVVGHPRVERTDLLVEVAPGVGQSERRHDRRCLRTGLIERLEGNRDRIRVVVAHGLAQPDQLEPSALERGEAPRDRRAVAIRVGFGSSGLGRGELCPARHEVVGRVVSNERAGLLEGRCRVGGVLHGVAPSGASPLEALRGGGAGLAGHVAGEDGLGQRAVVARALLPRRRELRLQPGLSRLRGGRGIARRAIAPTQPLELVFGSGALGQGGAQRLTLRGDGLGELSAPNERPVARRDRIGDARVVAGQVRSAHHRAHRILEIEQGQRIAIERELDAVGEQRTGRRRCARGREVTERLDQPGAAKRTETSDDGDLTVQLDRGAIANRLSHPQDLHRRPPSVTGRATVPDAPARAVPWHVPPAGTPGAAAASGHGDALHGRIVVPVIAWSLGARAAARPRPTGGSPRRLARGPSAGGHRAEQVDHARGGSGIFHELLGEIEERSRSRDHLARRPLEVVEPVADPGVVAGVPPRTARSSGPIWLRGRRPVLGTARRGGVVGDHDAPASRPERPTRSAASGSPAKVTRRIPSRSDAAPTGRRRRESGSTMARR